MNYRAALVYFRDRSDYDRGFVSNPFAGDEAAQSGLRRTRNLLDALGAPDRGYSIIHVAGTKGKGSTCAFIDAVARAAGLRTGLFVTPHLHTVRERTQVDASPISEADFARFMEVTSAAVAQIEAARPADGSVTAFEISTAMSLLAFARAGVDLAIVEVGLGGRLDATNVVAPAVSVITPVSFDHEAILGDSLADIAAEKAGIIKPGVSVVVGPQEVEAREVILDVASLNDARATVAGVDWTTAYDNGLSRLAGPWGTLDGVRLSLRGLHQSLNAGAALMALWKFRPDLLRDLGAVKSAIESTRWPGRFEQILDEPVTIADGAHNVASMAVLAKALTDAFGEARYICVFGSYRDKNLDAMLRALAGLNPTVVATQSRGPRARSPEEIVAKATALGLRVVSEPAVQGALERAVGLAYPSGVVVVTGSLSVVAEAREAVGLGNVSALEREIMST